MRKTPFYILLTCLILISSNQKLDAQFFKNTIDTLKQHRTIKISETDKWNIRGTSLNYFNVQDTKMTPLVYSGPGIGLDFSTYKTRKLCSNYNSFNLHYSVLLGPSDDIMHGVKFRYNYTRLRKLNSSNLEIGGGTNMETNARIYTKNGNDPIGVEILTTLNFAAAYTTDFKNSKIEILAQLPLFAFASRYPDYSVFGFNNLFMPIGQYNSIRTKFTLIKPMKYSNENKYSISYEWDIYSFKEYDKLFNLVAGTHLITFSYWLKKK